MTFTEIVNRVANDLNQTSADALTLIGSHVNQQYRRLVALPWLQISRRGEISQNTAVGNRYVTFPVTKLYSVFDPTRGPNYTLGELTFDELRNQVPMSDPPNNYAIARADSASITIFLDCIPATIYPLSADVEQRIVTLSGGQSPKFDEDFHDILIYGAKELYLLKQEKPELASIQKGGWDSRISDLKFHIAKTGYLNYLQGKDRADATPVINNYIS